MKWEITKEFVYVDVDKKTGENLGATFNDKRRMFRLPNNLAVLRDVYKISKDPKLVQYGKDRARSRDRFMRMKMEKDAHGDERLRPYQRVDVQFLKHLPSAAIFNEQRTGKTPTTLVLLKEREYKKMIFVVPAGLLLNWKEEFEKWHGELKAIVIRGAKKRREKLYAEFSKADKAAMIISYETLRNDVDAVTYLSHDALVLDEAHRLRSRKSLQTEAVKRLGRASKHRYALTGTPSVRGGDDVWSILNFLYPDRFPGYWQFIERYFETALDWQTGNQKVNGKYKRQEELEEILATIGVNRKRKEVMPWLPDKQYTTIMLELTDKQNKVYKKVEEEFVYEENGETLVDCSSHLAQLTRLRQITLAPSTLGIDAPSAKEKFLLEWLEDNPNEPVIVFSQFTKYLKQLQEIIKERTVMIHGELSANEKHEAARQFQQGKSRILLANIIAAGTGFTLDKATTTIFLDKAWNPSDNAQAEDRMVPTAEERNHKMDVISLVTKDTYDEKIELLLQHKYDISEVINSGGINALNRLYEELNS